MKITQVKLKGFKRFHDLTINLESPSKRIIALVGLNGCGKSSVFDAFEVKAAQTRGLKQGVNQSYFSKSAHSSDIEETYATNKNRTRKPHNKKKASTLEAPIGLLVD